MVKFVLRGHIISAAAAGGYVKMLERPSTAVTARCHPTIPHVRGCRVHGLPTGRCCTTSPSSTHSVSVAGVQEDVPGARHAARGWLRAGVLYGDYNLHVRFAPSQNADSNEFTQDQLCVLESNVGLENSADGAVSWVCASAAEFDVMPEDPETVLSLYRSSDTYVSLSL
eukprot:COSAG02_NODE_1853_length_10660_cov_23.960231_1_plen_169_part_00